MSQSSREDRDAYIEGLTAFTVPQDDAEARACLTLDGLYEGESQRIYRLIQIAYRRGMRRGASLAWSARQQVSVRRALAEDPDPQSRHQERLKEEEAR